MFDLLYMVGSCLIWFGALAQIYRILNRKRSNDISFHYIGCLLIAHLIMLPRALDSDYWVWTVSRIVSAILVFTLLMMVFYYREERNVWNHKIECPECCWCFNIGKEGCEERVRICPECGFKWRDD